MRRARKHDLHSHGGAAQFQRKHFAEMQQVRLGPAVDRVSRLHHLRHHGRDIDDVAAIAREQARQRRVRQPRRRHDIQLNIPIETPCSSPRTSFTAPIEPPVSCPFAMRL